MPLDPAAIGTPTDSFESAIDARWIMAFSAGLGDVDACYLDTAAESGIVAHPLFAICPEWPVALATRDLCRRYGLTDVEFRRAVHATHDSHVYRLLRPDDRVQTQATIVAMEARRPGAFVTTRFDTLDAAGNLVCRTFNGTLYRDVAIAPSVADPVDVAAVDVPAAPPLPETAFERAIDIPIAANLAHVYTECARIWNPIHTDRAVALGAGLPDIILHGSAPLALAVSAIVRAYGGGEPSRVTRIGAQFRGMVMLPSVLTLRCHAPTSAEGGACIAFDIVNAAGASVIRAGHVTLAELA